MSDVKLVRELLIKAQQELAALKEMEHNENIVDEIFGFLAQQAVEKTLKAWMAYKGIQFDLTHDISRLLTELKKYGEDVERFWDLIDLNPFAVQFRYELIDEGEPSLDRTAWIEQVRVIIDTVDKNTEKQ